MSAAGTLANEEQLLYILGGLYLLAALAWGLARHDKTAAWLLAGMGAYLLTYNLVVYVAQPIAAFSRTLPRGFWSNAVFQFADYVKVFFQTPPPLTAIVYTFLSVVLLTRLRSPSTRPAHAGLPRPTTPAVSTALAVLLLALIGALCTLGQPLALVGTPFIIIAAFVVRSLPASVRSGIAALQQIDPAIEEASGMLGADSQYTFRRVTLPLIVPAFLAGLIFSFTRHMTSLSAIIFLVSPRWRIVTASILSEWEQGGMSIAAAYSTVIIVVVMLAIGLLYLVVNRLLRGHASVDLTPGL